MSANRQYSALAFPLANKSLPAIEGFGEIIECFLGFRESNRNRLNVNLAEKGTELFYIIGIGNPLPVYIRYLYC
jgi:hypothetical protein